MDFKTLILIVFISFCSINPAVGKSLLKQYTPWWEKAGVDSENDPLVKRAEMIFSRVSAVADKRASRPPRLVVVKDPLKNWVVTLANGTIIIRYKTLEILFGDQPRKKGDANLAFIFGHELSHLTNDHFWHLEAVSRIKKYAAEKYQEPMMALFEETMGGYKSQKNIVDLRTKELEADEGGIVYMALAGYDPWQIVGRDGRTFFEYWMRETGRKAEGTQPKSKLSSHPDYEQRAVAIQTKLRSVTNSVELFHFGVRLYQIGEYQEARLILERFRKYFPGREVFNNIGLVYYQLALGKLAACDEGQAYRFMLSTQLDIKTRAVRSRRFKKSSCLKNRNFQRYLQESILNFEEARDRDLQYLPARINLSSAYLISERYSEAIIELDQALSLRPHNREALNNLAIVHFFKGRENQKDRYEESSRVLTQIITDHPEFPDPYYNLAAIHFAVNDLENALIYWKQFLERNPTGNYADVVKGRLGMRTKNRLEKQKRVGPKSSISLGRISKKDRSGWKRMTGFSEGYINRDIFQAGDHKIYAVDDNAVIVEQTAVNMSEAFVRKNGEPLRSIPNTVGKTLVYPSQAIDVREGLVTAIAFY
jgi:tetratricopeptide (TPR) repeat protein